MNLKILMIAASLLIGFNSDKTWANESRLLKVKFDNAAVKTNDSPKAVRPSAEKSPNQNIVEEANPKQTMTIEPPLIDIVDDTKKEKKEFDPHKALKIYPWIGAKIGGLAGLILGALAFKSIAGALLGVAILGALGLIAGGLMALRGTLLKMFPPPEPEERQKEKEEQKKQ